MKRNIFINTNNAILYIYQTQGLLKFPDNSVKINRDIAITLSYCKKNLSLNESLQHYKQDNSNIDLYKITLGIMALIEDQILLTKDTPWDTSSFTVIWEDDVFYPESLHIELTAKCNLHCFYCYRKSHENIKEDNRLSTEELKNIIISLSEQGLKVVELTGGEPLLHPDFMEILDVCYHNLSLMSIITNGTLIDENFLAKILQYKDKIVFSISLDSHLEEDHDRRCGVKGSYVKTVRGIKLLAENGFIVRTAMVIDENNWSQVEDTLLFSKSIGATKFAYSPILPFGRAEQDYSFWKKISIEKVKQQDERLKEEYADFIHYITEKEQQQLNEGGNCGAGDTSFVMDPVGNIRICASYDEDEGVIGSLKNSSFNQLFKSKVCALSSKISPPMPFICGNCQHLFFCMGCALRGAKRVPVVGHENCHWAKDKNVKQWLSLINVN
jgi:radical SAM protein with 4Fe4S-binding SPASM domain